MTEKELFEKLKITNSITGFSPTESKMIRSILQSQIKIAQRRRRKFKNV